METTEPKSENISEKKDKGKTKSKKRTRPAGAGRKPGKKNDPRYCKLDNSVIDTVYKLKSIGLQDSIICDQIGITHKTFIEWKKKGANSSSGLFHRFFMKYKKGRAQFVSRNLNEIQKQGMENKQWQALAWTLERTRPDLFGKRDPSEFEKHTSNKIEVHINPAIMEKPAKQEQVDETPEPVGLDEVDDGGSQNG